MTKRPKVYATLVLCCTLALLASLLLCLNFTEPTDGVHDQNQLDVNGDKSATASETSAPVWSISIPKLVPVKSSASGLAQSSNYNLLVMLTVLTVYVLLSHFAPKWHAEYLERVEEENRKKWEREAKELAERQYHEFMERRSKSRWIGMVLSPFVALSMVLAVILVFERMRNGSATVFFNMNDVSSVHVERILNISKLLVLILPLAVIGTTLALIICGMVTPLIFIIMTSGAIGVIALYFCLQTARLGESWFPLFIYNDSPSRVLVPLSLLAMAVLTIAVPLAASL